MRLFLPIKGWHIRLKQPVEEYGDILDEKGIEQANGNLLDEPDEEAILMDEKVALELLGWSELKWIKECWYWTTEDEVPYPEAETMGWQVEVCAGKSVIYHDYDRAIIDLAGLHAPVGRLLYVLMYGPEMARPIARAVLDGDRAALGVLADALEEAAHADAKEIRKLAKAEPKNAKPEGGRGKPLNVTPPPSPPVKASKSLKAAQVPAATANVSSTELRPCSTPEIVVVTGYPAAGKSSLVQTLVDAKYQRLNRDTTGGTLEELHRQVRPLFDQGRSVVLDNLYPTAAARSAMLKAIGAGVPVRLVLLDTSMEDAQFNACLRMAQKHGRVLHPEDHKKAPFKDDASAYPVAVMYKYRNDFEEPKSSEGFASIQRIPFVRSYPNEWVNKAAIFDFDGTLRTHEGKEKFPCKPSEVRAMKERAAKLRELSKQGYLLLGASNQSGVAKGKLSAADAEACFAETAKQLGVTFREILYCPHKVPPLVCYCRKPNPGMGVQLIVKYKLDPRQCIYVGDQGTDRSFAEKCGFTFADQAQFFA